MATRAQALIPITIAAAIVGIVGLAAVPDDVKLESVEDDNPRRVRGLMFQEGLEYDEGMIFKFENEGVHSLWMLNMQFPLDMIWFDSDGRVALQSFEDQMIQAYTQQRLELHNNRS